MGNKELIRSVSELQGRTASSFALHEDPSQVLLCPPDYFDVVDVKNPHMSNQLGNVDQQKARRQWEALQKALKEARCQVHLIEASKGLEDMVFAANPVFVGKNSQGVATCFLSNMKHSSRQKEVPAYREWFSAQGYQLANLSSQEWVFEGHGDALWHPARHLIWGGYGFRTVPEVYEELSQTYNAPVILVELTQEHFYHLDTCLCPLSETEALYFPQAFQTEGRQLIQALFSDSIEIPEKEAKEGFACNALPVGKKVLIQKGNKETNQELKRRGYEPIELDTREFMKSGGSVFCMKSMVY